MHITNNWLEQHAGSCDVLNSNITAGGSKVVKLGVGGIGGEVGDGVLCIIENTGWILVVTH